MRRRGIGTQAAVFTVILVFIVAAIGAIAFTQRGAAPEPTTSSTEATQATLSGGPCAKLVTLNGTGYCADDVSNDTVLGGPGYSYFRNVSIAFMGVTFQTYCPWEYAGCPGANGTVTEVMLGVIRFTMTFPDNTNETVGAPIGDLTYVHILSSHSDPRAGMLIEIENGPQRSTAHVFLLVSEASPGPTQVAVTTVTAPAIYFATSGGANFECSTVMGSGAWFALTDTGTSGADVTGVTLYSGGANNAFVASGACAVGSAGSSTSTIYLDLSDPAALTVPPVSGQSFLGVVTLSNGQEAVFVGAFS